MGRALLLSWTSPKKGFALCHGSEVWAYLCACQQCIFMKDFTCSPIKLAWAGEEWGGGEGSPEVKLNVSERWQEGPQAMAYLFPPFLYLIFFPNSWSWCWLPCAYPISMQSLSIWSQRAIKTASLEWPQETSVLLAQDLRSWVFHPQTCVRVWFKMWVLFPG